MNVVIASTLKLVPEAVHDKEGSKGVPAPNAGRTPHTEYNACPNQHCDLASRMDRSEPLARRHSFHSFHDSTSVPEDGSDVMSIDDDPWLDCRPLSWSYPDNTVVADSGDVGDVGFRVQHVSPMVLCDLCSALNIDRLWNQILSDIARGDCIEHQPDVEALELSASAGCEMCSMFLQGAVATFHRLPGQKFSDAGAIQYLKNKTTRSAPQRPPSWVRALSRGDGPCLVRKINYEDTEGSFIKAIEYGIPVLPLQGYMDFNMKHCLTTQFVLRNCRGTLRLPQL